MIHGFNIAVCMCDEFSTATIKSLPSLVFVFCRHYQIFLFVVKEAKKKKKVCEVMFETKHFITVHLNVCLCVWVSGLQRKVKLDIWLLH